MSLSLVACRRALRVAILASILVGSYAYSAEKSPATERAFTHPGLLHTQDDFLRMQQQVEKGAEPWKSGWDRLVANSHANLNYKPQPVKIVYRGRSANRENYRLLFNDIAAAYACGLRWKISGDVQYADKSIEIMNAWSATLKRIDGSSDRFLAAGIYGYQFANAAEIMRDYKGWKSQDFKAFQHMMLEAFYPSNHDFLVRHNGAKIDHYWCNWDACNMASILAIGVLCDRRDLFDEAIEYFKNGKGNGAIMIAVNPLYPDEKLGQFQESGRDQGHATLCIGLLGAFCEMAWNQGEDMYGYADNRFLAGAEYVAKYNLGFDVPYTPYRNSDVSQPVISANGRGTTRPVWEMLYNHYVIRKGLSAPYTTQFAEKVRPEGGGGDYGPNSGGFDQLGYGTLTFTLNLLPSR